jgi:hypothetical protein
MMAFFVFVGLFVAATANAVLGTMIALAALVFLFFTLAKTSLILLPFVLVVSHIAERARQLGVKMVVCLGPLLVWVIVIAAIAPRPATC